MQTLGATLYNGVAEKVKALATKNATGLTQSEADFIANYLEFDGDNIKAVMKMHPDWTSTSARVESYRLLRKPQIQAVLTSTLKVETLNANWIGTKFKQLATKGKSEDVQLRATREIARMVGVYAQEGGPSGSNGSGVTININVPGGKVTMAEVIDADFTEV